MNTPEKRIVTEAELLGFLEGYPIHGAKQGTIITLTHPDMLMKDRITREPNPWLPEGVSRLSHRMVTLGASYEASVNRQRLREATPDQVVEYFHAEALWHGKGKHHGPYTVIHVPTGRLYFAYKPYQPDGIPKSIEDEWRSVKTGAILDHHKLVNFLPPASKAWKQEVDQDVAWRTIALENVVELHYGGIQWVLNRAA